MIASGGQDGRITLWDAHTGDRIEELKNEGYNPILDLVFVEDDSLIAIFASTLFEVWSVKRSTLERSDNIHAFDIPSSDFSPSRRLLARGGPTYNGAPSIIPFLPGRDNSVYIEDVVTLERVAVYKGHSDTVTSISFTEDGNYLITGSSDRTIRMWAIEESRR